MRSFGLLALLVGGAAVLAGCTTNSAPGGENVHTAFLSATTFKPFNTDTPEHTWFKLDDGRMQFIHWDNADPAKATGPLFLGDGLKGALCFGKGGISRSDYDAGFVHFHSAEAPNWDAGHNNGGKYDETSKAGWWLRHVGAKDATMNMMGHAMTVKKGEVFQLMPADKAKVKDCPGGVTLKDNLLATYTFTPFNTDTPEHVWRKVDDTHLTFLHWNKADVAQADTILFVGEGVKTNFCFGAGGISAADYDAGFVHFHKAVAANWDAGHNNAGNYADHASGWWLRHVGAIDGKMTMMGHEMTIKKGEVFPLMPAEKAKVQPC